MTHEDAITKLQVMHTWASYSLENHMIVAIFDKAAVTSIEKWTLEIIAMMKAEEDDGK